MKSGIIVIFASMLVIAGCTVSSSHDGQPDAHLVEAKSNPFTPVTQGKITKVEGQPNWAVRPGVFSGGQPTESSLQLLASQGVEEVINLRPVGEQPFNERVLVESLGMEYHQIDVAGAAGITVDNALALDRLLRAAHNKSVLVHCASGNRVGALVSLALVTRYDMPLDDAILVGKQWGLGSLEPKLRSLLESE